MFLTSTFDEVYKKSPIIEILRDKLVEITDYKGLNDFYLLNSNTDLNNLGTKTVQLFLANENVKTEKEQYFDDKKLELDENDLPHGSGEMEYFGHPTIKTYVGTFYYGEWHLN